MRGQVHERAPTPLSTIPPHVAARARRMVGQPRRGLEPGIPAHGASSAGTARCSRGRRSGCGRSPAGTRSSTSASRTSATGRASSRRSSRSTRSGSGPRATCSRWATRWRRSWSRTSRCLPRSSGCTCSPATACPRSTPAAASSTWCSRRTPSRSRWPTARGRSWPLTVWMFVLSDRERDLAAVPLGFAAGLTRVTGLALVPPLALRAWRRRTVVVVAARRCARGRVLRPGGLAAARRRRSAGDGARAGPVGRAPGLPARQPRSTSSGALRRRGTSSSSPAG